MIDRVHHAAICADKGSAWLRLCIPSTWNSEARVRVSLAWYFGCCAFSLRRLQWRTDGKVLAPDVLALILQVLQSVLMQLKLGVNILKVTLDVSLSLSNARLKCLKELVSFVKKFVLFDHSLGMTTKSRFGRYQAGAKAQAVMAIIFVIS